MPPPRYHFPSRPTGPALARPNRPGSTLHQREDVADCTFCVSWNGNPPVKFVGGWELPGYVGRLGGGSWELPPGDASRKTLKQRQFFFFLFYGFWEAFWGTLFACFSFIYLCAFSFGGALDKCGTWRSLISGFCLSSLVAVLSLSPFHQLMLWGPAVWILKGIHLWKGLLWVMKAVPLLNPKPGPKPTPVNAPWTSWIYVSFLLIYLYIYIYIYYIHIYTVYINKQPILPPIFLQIKWKFLKHGSQFSVSPSRGVHRDNKPSTSLGTCRLGNPGISGITCGPRTPKWV